LVVSASMAELRWHPSSDFESDEQANYLGQSQVLRFLQSLIGPEFRPAGVKIVSKPWRYDVDALERFFGCRIYGHSPANIISFPAEALQRRLRTSNPMLFGLLGSYFAQVKVSAQRSYTDEVRACARVALTAGNCSISQCAAKMQVSPRTIQRRLTEQGVRFSDIVEEARIEASKRALHETDDSLSEIALNMGYSDQSSFGRAFKRWTGSTPQSFRAGRLGPSTGRPLSSIV